MSTEDWPLVSAVVAVRSDLKRVTAMLLGRVTVIGGKAVAAEVRICEDSVMGPVLTDRITLISIRDLEPLTDAARSLMAERGK